MLRATATDEAGNVFIAGSFGEVITFGSLTLHSAGGHDFFLAKYTDLGTAGAFNWLRVDGGTDYCRSQGLVAHGAWVYTAGYSFFNRTNTRRGIAGSRRRPPGTRYRADAPFEVKGRPYLAGYYDEGPRAALRWVRVFDYPFQLGGRHYGLGLCGPRLYVMGSTWLPARFGRFVLGRPGQGLGFVVAGLAVGAVAAAHPVGRGAAR